MRNSSSPRPKTDDLRKIMAPSYFLLILGILRSVCYESAEANLVNGGGKNENGFITGSEEIALESINGTRDFKITRKSKDNKSWYNGRETRLTHCVRKAKCETSKYKTCLGSKLPYSSTSLRLADCYSQERVQEKLQQYAVLKHIPKCWAVIQPYLCAVFMPKCERIDETDMVYLPSLEMCRKVMEPCKLVYNTSFFPEYLKCNTSFLHSKCDNDVREMKFNLSGTCLPPLVHTDIAFHFYDGISGCGLPCRDPLYTEDEHNQISRLIMWGASINLALSLFAVSTFLIDWKSSSKYPALIIFYINVCCVISSIGWLSQFIFDSREDIVCSKDGTRRRGEPSAGENLSCVVIFVLVYYFQIAQCVWFVIFTYAWDISFKRLGKIQDRIDKKGAYFHLVAWSLPLVLTITTMALGEIDGSSITGICFVGYLNHFVRSGLLLGPLLLFLLIGEYFLSHCIWTLVHIRTSSKDILSIRASSKIRATIMRCSITAILKAVFIIATFVCHMYEFSNSKSWYDSFRTFLVCRLTTMGGEPNECVQSSRPSVAILQLQLLCLFCSMVLMASWVWTHATIDTWKRYIRIKCGFESEEPVKLQKHKLIAQAFARRKEFHNQGRMSISFHNTHTDPLGFKFELNSVASHDFSSTWANNLPRFVKRRGALTGAQYSQSQSSNAPRRNSQDSQISFSLRHVSVESKRDSVDSQVSVKMTEMETKVATSRRRMKSHKASRRRPPRNMTVCTRRESGTSIESHILKSLSANKSRRRDLVDSSSRRTAITELSKKEIDLLLQDGNFCKMKEVFETHRLSATSDDENCSKASFKIRDSQLNIVLHKKDLNHSVDGINIPNSAKELALLGYHSDSDITTGNELAPVQYKKNNLDSVEIMKNNAIYCKEYFKDVCGSKSSSKSKSSRRSSRQSGRIKSKRPIKTSFKTKTSKCRNNNQRSKKNSNSTINDTSKSSSESSYDSFAELGHLGNMSSYSGLSVGKNNSRNSKKSCDVGIQANYHEISTQTLTSHNADLKNNSYKSQNIGNTSIKSGNINSLKDSNKIKYKTSVDNDVIALYRKDSDKSNYKQNDFELHVLNKNVSTKHNDAEEPLLGAKSNIDKPIVLKKRNDLSNMSESKKLKQLLLPSNK